MPKIAFQKSGVINFTWVFGHCTVQNKDVGLELCVLVVGIKLYKVKVYLVFTNKIEISEFIRICENGNFKCGVENRKK